MHTELIAEIGMHHDGDVNRCKQLCVDAIKAGASAVKFQLYTPEEIAIAGSADFEAFSKQKFLTHWEFSEVTRFCKQENIMFGISPFGVESTKQAMEHRPNFLKIASSEVTDIPTLREMDRTSTRKIASFGSASECEILRMIQICHPTTFLHCVLLYPAPKSCVPEIVDGIIKAKHYGRPGLSSHFVLDPMLTPLTHAVCAGAQTLEVHFTDDKKQLGQDHAWSMDAQDIKNFREWEYLRSPAPDFEIYKRLNDKRRLAYKSIVAKCDIAVGEKFTPENITTKRPGYGMHASRWDEALKATAPTNFKKDDFILW